MTTPLGCGAAREDKSAKVSSRQKNRSTVQFKVKKVGVQLMVSHAFVQSILRYFRKLESMKTLALETSTPFLCLGWLDASQRKETILRVERAHAEQLAGQLEAFLKGLPHADLIVIGAGPGSYTGLRVAAGFALGLARAWQARVVHVPTLEAIALQASGVVAVSLDAHRGQVYSAVYLVEPSPKFGLPSIAKVLQPLEKRSFEAFAALIPKGATHLGDVAPSGIALAQLGLLRLELGAQPDLLYL